MTTLPPHIANAKTPRTDKMRREILSDMQSGVVEVVHASFSRQLERENLYLREVLEKLAKVVEHVSLSLLIVTALMGLIKVFIWIVAISE